MNAMLNPPHRFVSAMGMDDIDAVWSVEVLACVVPWTHGNFIDSIAVGHHALLVRGARGELLGYLVAMEGVDELHLLNLTVNPAYQRLGHGRFLLEELVRLAGRSAVAQLLLEVRQSNVRAQALYLDFGFTQIGLRRGYYPLPAGAAGREDAWVMSLRLPSASLPTTGEAT